MRWHWAFLSFPPLPPPPSFSLSLRWRPRSWRAACPAGRCAPRGRTSSPRRSGARPRSRPRPWRTPRHRRQRCSRRWPCTASGDESFCESSEPVFARFIGKMEIYPTAGRRGSSSLAHWFRSRITVVVLGTGRRLVTSWKKSDKHRKKEKSELSYINLKIYK